MFKFLIVLAFLLSSSCSPVSSSEALHADSGKDQADSKDLDEPERLSTQEEDELRRLVPQVVLWADRWQLPLRCRRESFSGQPQVETPYSDWRMAYEEMLDKEVVLQIEPSPYQVTVFLRQLGMKLKFNRKGSSRLEPLSPEKACDADSQVSTDYSIRILLKRHEMTPLTSEPKRTLFQRLADMVRENSCLSLSNVRGGKIRITVPNFEVGDPELFVLLEGKGDRYSEGVSIDWIRFELNSEDGNFYPVLEKNFGLPDETRPRKNVIEKIALETFEVECKSDSE